MSAWKIKKYPISPLCALCGKGIEF